MTGATTYNLTIDDTSPQIVYLPPTFTNATSDLLAGWSEYYSGTGFSSYLGQIGRNTSWHVTSRDGAALSIGFTGVCCSSVHLCPGDVLHCYAGYAASSLPVARGT